MLSNIKPCCKGENSIDKNVCDAEKRYISVATKVFSGLGFLESACIQGTASPEESLAFKVFCPQLQLSHRVADQVDAPKFQVHRETADWTLHPSPVAFPDPRYRALGEQGGVMMPPTEGQSVWVSTIRAPPDTSSLPYPAATGRNGRCVGVFRTG